MRSRSLLAASLVALLMLGGFASAAIAQPYPPPPPPPTVDVDDEDVDVIDDGSEEVDEEPDVVDEDVDEVDGVVDADPTEVRQPVAQEEPAQVLGQVLSRTGADALLIAVIGLVLLTLGVLAVRRTRPALRD